jgi:alkylation response protein AidB-like acyl-CoA dehydrogenase
MDFGLSEDQQLLESTLRGFLKEQMPIERVRKLREEGAANDRAAWQALAELGMTGILIAEEHGGSALALLDAALVSQTLGYAVAPVPFTTSGVMAPVALASLPGTDAWLAGIASGELVFGVAVTEAFSVREEAGVVLGAKGLSGKAMMALDADAAVIRGDAAGLESTRLATIDATRSTSELLLTDVAPEAVFDDAGDTLARMLDAGRVALAADTLGACESMIEQAVSYAMQRKQFERVIGSFQAVKHMCAEMVAELEPARSLLWYAAHAFDALPEEAPLMACHVLAHVSEIGREIASVATQVHGGIGWTDEQNLHFWFKRVGNARHLLGGPEYLRNRAAELQGFAA